MRFLFPIAVLFAFLPQLSIMADPPFRTVAENIAAGPTAAALEDDRILCLWIADSGPEKAPQVMGAYFANTYDAWFGPRLMLRDTEKVSDAYLLRQPDSPVLWLLTVEGAPDARGVYLRQSENNGASWSAPTALHTGGADYTLGSAAFLDNNRLVVGVIERSTDGRQKLILISGAPDGDWHTASPPDLNTAKWSAPVLLPQPEGIMVYVTSSDAPHRYFRSRSASGREWSRLEAANLPSAVKESAPARTLALLPLDNDRVLIAGNGNVAEPGTLSIGFSYDGGRTWPVRRPALFDAPEARPTLVSAGTGFHALFRTPAGGIGHLRFDTAWINAPTALSVHPPLANVVPPLSESDHRNTPDPEAAPPLPLSDEPFFEHVRHIVGDDDWPGDGALAETPANLPGVNPKITTPVHKQNALEWLGTEDGLYHRANPDAPFARHPAYGVHGPLSNVIAGLAVDSRQTLWVATPAGLSARDSDGHWTSIRGREGLPWEELTCIEVDGLDRLWIGSTRGLILHCPYASDRQWYYRAGERYLPGDHVHAIVIAKDSRSAYLRTDRGVGRIVEEALTLYDKAEYIETRFNKRHRRLGMPSPARYDDPYTMEHGVHGPQPSDGLWTSYHVTAMALAYSLTFEERYRASAQESMEALYLLQNVTGIHGLVARSVVSVDEAAAAEVRHLPNWHLTSDGRYLWRDDVSSDQIDGHFLGFYSYFEHIAQFDPEARRRVEQQVRQVMDYILDNNYMIPDWHGARTLWGWFNPELVNHDPTGFLESGLYSLMMLSFLHVTYYITGDESYMDHYRYLIEEHGYLSNLLLEKKLYPDELNHSDDQLSAVAYYPMLQLARDPYVREALHRAVRRHALIEKPERNSLFAFVYATIDPEDADVAGGVRTLREFPRDRRDWRMENAHRADVVLRPNLNPGGPLVLLDVLPYDEHHFERWNQDPYDPNGGGSGRLEGSGEHYLIPYWIGRYHGLIAPPNP